MIKGDNLCFQVMYCNDESWSNLQKSIASVHGPSSVVICIFGSIANLINIAVLTRRSMVSPTNAILTVLAITDLLVMVDYIPFAFHQYILTTRSIEDRFSFNWAVFVLFHSQFAQVFHTFSIAITLSLAVWRYIAIGFPQHNIVWCSMSRVKIAMAVSFIFSVVFNIPNYMNVRIKDVEYENTTVYLVDLADKTNIVLNTANFIVYSVILKLLPCVALTVLSLALIHELLVAAKRRAKLMNKSNSGRKADAGKQADRVTKMLLAVLILFLVSEVPQGILGLLYILPKSSFTHCYEKMGDVMDMLVLFNSAINFFLYCSMSQQFRDTFMHLCTPCLSAFWNVLQNSRLRRVPQTDIGIEMSEITTCNTRI